MRTLLVGLLLLGGIGCTGIQPVGPLAKGKGLPPGGKDAAGPDPVTVAAPRPVPPAVLITPGEVTPDSSAAAVEKLTNEFEYDRKNTTTSKTAEVSRIRGGIVN